MQSVARCWEGADTGPYSGRMNPASAASTPHAAGVIGRTTASLRRAFIAYARWLDSISWKRFVLLSVLALIASGILTALPPFNIEWGGSGKPTPAEKRSKAAAKSRLINVRTRCALVK